jgi:Leucine-rich repeat (LRR) protein
VLWLADNYISSISGLASLSQLQQLHLARNYVADIGASLGSCTALTSLNLAHNHISNLQVRCRGSVGLCRQQPAHATPSTH